MAVYDREQQRIVLRIVYDGPARAGKTTNVRQLAEYFTHRRRSEVVVPDELQGRTMYFDFMQLDGGLVAGETLRCQFVTVPGQRRLAARRKLILETADVVVFVCSSAERSLTVGRATYESLRWALRGVGRQHVPIVVQANKQDLKSALSLTDLRQALQLAESIPMVGATAHDGAGVRETAVLAIRAAAKSAETILFEQGLDALLGHAESAEDLLGKIKARASHAPDVNDILREINEYAGDEEEERLDAEDDAPVPAVAVSIPVATAPPSPPSTIPSPAPNLPSAAPQPADVQPQTVRVEVALEATHCEPPRPTDEVPTGCVWPSSHGRQVLRTLAGQPWTLRPELSGQVGMNDGSGAADVLIYRVGEHCAKTSARRSFPSVDEGRAALLNLARRKILLGELLLPDTVVALQEDKTGPAWLWTVTPWVSTLRAQLNTAAATNDGDALGAALRKFADACVSAMLLAARREVVLDVHPSNFGSFNEAVYYLDDDIAAGSALPAIGHAVLQRVEEHGDFGAAVDAYLAHLSEQLRVRVSPTDLRTLGLLDSLDATITRSARASDAREKLLQVARAHARGRAA